MNTYTINLKLFYHAIFVALVLLPLTGHAQMQLVLLKKEKVLLRLNPGDEFVFRLKDSKSIRRSYVNNLSDTSVTIHSEVIPFRKIDRIYFSQFTFYNKMGVAFVTGGALLFIIDQVNVSLVQGDEASLDRGVSITSLALVGAGLPMMLIKKKSQRIKRKYRVMMVKKGSPFYQEDPRSFLSN